MRDRRPPLIVAVLPAAVLAGALVGYWRRPVARLSPPVPPPSLAGAALFGKDLRGAVLAGADLRGADLTGKDLRGANLTGAWLEGANLRGALYDRSTRWPAGFDPRAHGAILVPSTR
jgi:uncharacterized protein YjbI with pentapeptide repeats